MMTMIGTPASFVKESLKISFCRCGKCCDECSSDVSKNEYCDFIHYIICVHCYNSLVVDTNSHAEWSLVVDCLMKDKDWFCSYASVRVREFKLSFPVNDLVVSCAISSPVRSPLRASLLINLQLVLKKLTSFINFAKLLKRSAD